MGNSKLRYRIIRVIFNSGIWIQHIKTDHNFIIINEKGFSLCFGKIRIKILVMVISMFIYFI